MTDENDTKKKTLTIEFKSDMDCIDEKDLVSEIVGMTNTEGGVLSAQILLGATLDDLDGNERDRLCNIIKYRKGDKTLLEFTDEEIDKAL